MIDSDNFIYVSMKVLLDIYIIGDKFYKFRGWYKGKIKLGILIMIKILSYVVIYDDKDDMIVVYEEV